MHNFDIAIYVHCIHVVNIKKILTCSRDKNPLARIGRRGAFTD